MFLRKLTIVGAVLTAAGLAATSGAWACSPNGRATMDRSEGPAGTQVVVEGINFEPPKGSMEVRWNTTGGRLLERAEPADTFRKTVEVPPVTSYPALRYIVVVQRHADGGISWSAALPFTVTGPAPGSTPTTQLPPQSPTTTQAPPVPDVRDLPAPPGDRPDQRGGAGTLQPGTITPGGAGAAGSPPPAAAARTDAAPPPSSGAQPGGPSTTLPPPTPDELAAEEVLPPDPADVWSGVEESAVAPSLTEPALRSPSGGAGLGVALVAVGAAGLLGGALAQVARRRRAFAR